MSKKRGVDLKPYLSILAVITTLFVVVFCKMEVRRMGYIVLKQSRQLNQLSDQHHLRLIEYARVTRPDRVRKLAISQLTLNDARKGQIIHFSGENIAVRQ